MPGIYTVSIQPPEGSGLASRIEGIELTVDTSLDVVLEPGFLLSGRVTDSEGKEIFPVIIIAQEPGMEWGEYIPAVAEGDADGSYRMRLMGGTYDLLVFEFVEDQSSGVGRKLVDVEVSADRTLDVVLPSSESAFTLSGTVTDDEGRGIAGLWIEAYDPATANYVLAFTQGDGTYTMKVPPGTYDLTVLAFLRSGLPKGRIKGVQITGDIVRHFIIGTEIITAVEGEYTDGIPRTFALLQSYPNPFNAVMVIPYALPKTCPVQISIYNMLGQEIRTLVDEVQPAGTYRVVWDGKDAGGRPVSSGTYFSRLEADAFARTRKALLIR